MNPLEQGLNNLTTVSREGAIDPMTSNLVEVVNGMLEFKDYSAYVQIYNELSALQKDSIYIVTLSNQAPYNDSSSIEEPPECVVFRKFIDRFNFVSLRDAENNRLDNFLSNGGDPSDFDFHFIQLPLMQALLNDKSEFKIGSHIFKYLDRYKVAVVTANDFGKLDELRSLPIEEVKNSGNLFVHDYLFDTGYDPIFEYDNNANPTNLRNMCEAHFRIVPGENGYSFINESTNIDPNNPVIFKWNIDGTTYTTSDINFMPFLHYGIGLSAQPEFSLTIKDCESTFTINEPLTRCYVSGFTQIVSSNRTTITFIADNRAPGSTYTWDFGDGSPAVTTTSPVHHHTYPTNNVGNYTTTLIVTNATYNCVSDIVQTATPLPVGCYSRDFFDYAEKYGGSNNKYKVRGELTTWRDYSHPHITTFYATTWSFKYSWPRYWNKKVDENRTDLCIHYYKDCNGPKTTAFPNQNSCGFEFGKVKKTSVSEVGFGPNVAFDSDLNSTHTLSDDGTTITLFLVAY